MATSLDRPVLAPRLRALLRGLRWRIRLYTLVEGLAVLVIWLAVMFWLALLIDYGPVLLGASELPWAARIAVLGIVGIGAAVILYRWVLRRTFAQLADHSMAVLLERRHGQFRDSLLTSVEMEAHPDHAREFNAEMLTHTSDEALSYADDVRLRRIFRWWPLARVVAIAMLLAGSVAAFAFTPATSHAFAKITDRFGLLKDDKWDRMAQLNIVGISTWRIEYAELVAQGRTAELADGRPRLVPAQVKFADGKLRVARGASPKLIVRAEVREHRPPGSVTLNWRSADDAAQVKMSQGAKSDEFIEYTFQRPPLKDILTTVEFQARGFDFRTPWHTLEVVDAPQIIDVQLVVERPNYLVDEQRSMFKAIEQPLIAGTQVPRGSRVSIVATANKDIAEYYFYDVETKSTTAMELSPRASHATKRELRYVIESLDRPVSLELMLVDTDNLATETPHLIAFGVKDDELPQVKVAVRGIGSAVTPDVTFPVAGQVADDYWLDRASLELAVNDSASRTLALPFARGGFKEAQIAEYKLHEGDNVYHRYDLREQRTRKDAPLELKPGDRLSLTFKAADRFDLEDFNVQTNPHAGVSERVVLDVVTPDELLIILDRRELELRRRLEQIVEEMTQTRDALVRVKAELTGKMNENSTAAPEDSLDRAIEGEDKKLSPEEQRQRQLALRRLRVQRAVNQSEKSRGETEGVGLALLDMVEQIENNRVDTEDRKERLRGQVAAPLLALVATDFPELDKRLAALNAQVSANELDPAAGLAGEHALAQADNVLLKLDAVLAKMLDLESFNELIELVRGLIDEQDEVINETKTLRKRQLFGLE